MIRNAFTYVTRKKLKSLIIIVIIATMSTFCVLGLGIKKATDVSSKKSLGNITNSILLEINRQVNPGTPRGGGNVKERDINRIAQCKEIYSYVKRINSVADLLDHEIIETPETLANQSPERAKNFKNAVMLTGVNDSTRENKFVSGAYKLVEGKHLQNEDKNKVLMHKDLAQKNHLKVGDHLKIKSNLYDADNEKQANEIVDLEIKGLFDGHNKGSVSAAQELYENTLITDVHSAAQVYGDTEETAAYQDATFFVKGQYDLNQVVKSLEKLDIDWREYVLINGASNYPAMYMSISSLYSIANKLFYGALIFAGIIVALLLLLWINARKREIAIMLSLGISKVGIFGQFMLELLFMIIPSYALSYGLAYYFSQSFGHMILNNVTADIAKQLANQGASNQLGAGAEVDGFNKMITSLNVHVSMDTMLIVIGFMTIVMVLALVISSMRILKNKEKTLIYER